MNTEALAKAIDGNFDNLKTIFNWAILLSLTVLWAGMRHKREIEAGGFKFDRAYAINFAAGLYSLANLGVIISITRLCELLRLADRQSAVSSLMLDPWPLNPVSYVTGDFFMLLGNGVGLGVWVLTWWLAFASMIAVRRQKPQHVSQGMVAAFVWSSLVVGLFLLILEMTVWTTAQETDHALARGFAIQNIFRVVACFVGWLVGRWILRQIENAAAAAVQIEAQSKAKG